MTQELDCSPETSVKASMYKTLLCVEGLMFKAHKNTEKEPGMLAALIICQPSEFTVRAVVTSHSKQSKVVEPSSPTFFHAYLSK